MVVESRNFPWLLGVTMSLNQTALTCAFVQDFVVFAAETSQSRLEAILNEEGFPSDLRIGGEPLTCPQLESLAGENPFWLLLKCQESRSRRDSWTIRKLVRLTGSASKWEILKPEDFETP